MTVCSGCLLLTSQFLHNFTIVRPGFEGRTDVVAHFTPQTFQNPHFNYKLITWYRNVELGQYRELIVCLAVACMSRKYAVKRSLCAVNWAPFKRSCSDGTSAWSLTSQTKCWDTNTQHDYNTELMLRLRLFYYSSTSVTSALECYEKELRKLTFDILC